MISRRTVYILLMLLTAIAAFMAIPARTGVGPSLEIADLGYEAKTLNPGDATPMECDVGDKIKFGSGVVVMKIRVKDVDPTADDPSDVKIKEIQIDNDNGSAVADDIAQIAIVDKDNRCILEAPQDVDSFPVTFDAEEFIIPDNQEDIIQIAVRLEDSSTLQDNAEGHTIKLRARIRYEERPSGAPDWETATKEVIDGGADEVIHNGGFESAVDNNYNGGIIPIGGSGIVQEFTVCDDDALGDDPVIDEIQVMNKEDTESESADFNDIAVINLFVKGETTPRASITPDPSWVPGTWLTITPRDFALIVRDDHCLTLQIGVVISPWAYPGHVIQLRTHISTYEPDTRESRAGEIHPSVDPEVVDGTPEVIGEAPERADLIMIGSAPKLPAAIDHRPVGFVTISWKSHDPARGLGGIQGTLRWNPKVIDPIDDPYDPADDTNSFEVLAPYYNIISAKIDHLAGTANFVLTYDFGPDSIPLIEGELFKFHVRGVGSPGDWTQLNLDLLKVDGLAQVMDPITGEVSLVQEEITANVLVAAGEVRLVMLGDVDGNGAITINDALLVAKYLVDPVSYPLTEEQLILADVAPPYYLVDVRALPDAITSADVAAIARMAVTFGLATAAEAAEVITLALSAHQQAQPQPLVVDQILAYPNPVVSAEAVHFVVEGQGIESVKVEIFDLAGRAIFDSGLVAGNALEWDLLDDGGFPVANGVYLYMVTIRGWDGQVIRSEVRKLVVMR